MADDTISRQDTLEAICTWDKFGVDALGRVVRWYEGLEPYVHLRDVVLAIENMPSAQPEITLESAIDYLHSIGWMQEHDRIMAESAQPERKTGRWIERNPQNSPDCRLIECSECGNAYIVGYNIDYDDWIDGRDFCMRCGADLRGGSNGKST